MFSSASSVSHDAPANQLLAALPRSQYRRLEPHLRLVTLNPGQVLYVPDEIIEEVYFPAEGLVSFPLSNNAGVQVELSVVGDEGVVGLEAILGEGKTAHRAVVQMGGAAWQLPAEVLLEEFEESAPLQRLLLGQLQARITEMSQSALCNHVHPSEQRLGRWLLTLHDRSHQAELDLTQEFLGRILGVSRFGVTAAAGSLKTAGLIDFRRGNVVTHFTILDRAGLEHYTCECYGVIRDAVRDSLAVV